MSILAIMFGMSELKDMFFNTLDSVCRMQGVTFRSFSTAKGIYLKCLYLETM